jgi:integrase
MAQTVPRGKQARQRRMQEGITARHQRRCSASTGEACLCVPTYQAQVYSPVDGKHIRKTFPTVAAARAWRQETQIAVRRGQLRGPSATTLNEAAAEWLAAGDAGTVRTRSGDAYKPSAIRAYRQSLNHHILPKLGSKRISAINKRMLQDLADQLTTSGLSPSSVRNAIIPIRAIYRRALDRDEVASDPSRRLRLPAVRGSRDRIALPSEATALLATLPTGERALWATGLYEPSRV